MRLNYAKLLIATFLAAAPTALASTTWYANGVSGNDANNCQSSSTACKTIGHAISLATAGDSIMVAAATYTENLTIGFTLNVIGSGASTTIIDGGVVSTVVTISSATAHVTLSRMTIRNGAAESGGGVENAGVLTISESTISKNFARFWGGGIYNSNSGRMRIINSMVTGNMVSGSCVKLCPLVGGGIQNFGGLTISNSTVSGNIAYGGSHAAGGGIGNSFPGKLTISDSTLSRNKAVATSAMAIGGAIDNFSTLTISNSTLSGNSATGSTSAVGGGIYNYGKLTMNNSTLSGNSAAGSTSAVGGGIYNNSGFLATLQNSILANSPSGGNCSGTVTSNGYNLSSDDTCNFKDTGDMNNTDPMLGPLQNNGGPTQTMALPSGSPAVDAGNPNGCTDGSGHLLKTDQRGMPRPDTEDTGGCDVGAYERQSD